MSSDNLPEENMSDPQESENIEEVVIQDNESPEETPTPEETDTGNEEAAEPETSETEDAGNAEPETPESEAVPKEDYQARMKVKSDEALRRKMAYLILIETIFIVITVALCTWMIFQMNPLKKEAADNLAKAQTADQELNRIKGDLDSAIAEKEHITQLRDQRDKDYTNIQNQLSGTNQTLETKAKELSDKNDQIQKLEAAINDLKSKGVLLDEVQRRNTTLEQQSQELKGQIAKLTKEKDSLISERDKIKKEFTDYQIKVANEEAIKHKKRDDFNKKYENYEPQATNALKALRELQKLLDIGMECDKFNQARDRVKDIIEDFRTNQGNCSKFLSYQLILAAYNNYNESGERWTTLCRTTLPKEFSGFKDKVLKFEQPIKEYRPWVDGIQINWLIASREIEAVEKLVQNRGDFDFDLAKCLICTGRHYIICPKCDGSGKCTLCDGTGKGRDDLVCPACAGSKECIFCNGQKEIPCPVCLLDLKLIAPLAQEKPEPEKP